MYRIVICEDEITQRSKIKNYIIKVLQDVSNQIKIFEYSSAEEFLNENPTGIDIYFLDIQMNNLTGMDLAIIIREKNNDSEIIFITSLLEYIQEGYKVRAYRYLLKPIEYEDLKEHILRCVSDIIEKRDNYMIVENKGITNKILISSITYIEVIKREIIIHTKDGIYCTKNSMDKIEKELKRYKFFRCHKSYLINMEQIEFIQKNTVFINGEEVPVSKHRISSLKTSLTYVLGDVLC